MNAWRVASSDDKDTAEQQILRKDSPAALLGALAMALSLALGCSGSSDPSTAGPNASAAPPGGAPTAGIAGGAPTAVAPTAGTPAIAPTAGVVAAPALPPPVEASPPIPWGVPPGGLPDGLPVAVVIDIGDLTGTTLGGQQYVYLFDGCRNRYLTPERFHPAAQSEFGVLLYGEFDPATGKPVGEPVVLGPEYIGPYGFQLGQGRQADVSPSGILAIQNVSTPERASEISVIPPQAQAPRVLADMPDNIRWFAWTAGNRLLVLQEGRLQLWEKGKTPALSFGEKLDLPIVISPGRNWVVAAVDKKYLEVYDVKTGEVRGRLGPEGKWKYLSISPDGKQLAGVRHAGPIPDNSSSPPQDRYDLHTWDLTTGKPAEHIIADRLAYGPPVSWVGPKHLYYDQRVFDLDSRMAVVALGLPSLGAEQDGRRGIQTTNVTFSTGSPDGRRWWTGNLGQAFTASIPLTPPGGKPAFDAKTAVKVDVTGGDMERNAQVKEAIARALTAAGRPMGENPWTVRVITKVEESGFQLYNKEQTFTPQAVRGELQLIAPDGASVGTIHFGGDFSEQHSAYLVRTTRNDPLQPMTTIYEYDFRGKDARAAILQECWDKALKMLESIKTLPTVWEVNGKYQAIPIQVNLQPPPGVPRPSSNQTTNPKS